MRKLRFAITIMLLIVSLYGCSERRYKLSGTIERLQCIDVIDVSPYKVSSIAEHLRAEAIATVPSEEYSSFITELTALPCQAYFMDPCEALLGYTVRIAYDDGSYELICAVSGLYCEDNSFNWKHLQFDEEAFKTFVERRIS